MDVLRLFTSEEKHVHREVTVDLLYPSLYSITLEKSKASRWDCKGYSVFMYFNVINLFCDFSKNNTLNFFQSTKAERADENNFKI